MLAMPPSAKIMIFIARHFLYYLLKCCIQQVDAIDLYIEVRC